MSKDRKILFVDDEQNILDTYRATLRKQYKVKTALGPEAGLEAVGKDAFAVVISDLKMPNMDGITFLKKVQDMSPDTVRIMLTGHADLTSAISAVNDGAVFRFLTKPTPLDEMVRTLDIAIQQYSLVVAERELLRGTLRGSVRILTDILGLVNPEAFGRSERVRRLAIDVGKKMELKQTLYLDLAAMLSQLGCVTLTDTALEKIYQGEELTPEEKQAYDMHPYVTSGMLAQIPRMEKVSDIILNQNVSLEDNSELPVEARILKACLDFDAFTRAGMEKQAAVDVLRDQTKVYDKDVVAALELSIAAQEGYVSRELRVQDIRPGMILEGALWSVDKVHIMAEGTEITNTALARMANFLKAKRLPPTVRVLVPVEDAD